MGNIFVEQLKEAYADTWSKHAYNTYLVAQRLMAWRPDLDLKIGHGAIDVKRTDEQHEAGEPDLFLCKGDRVLIGIEVTGSNRVTIYPESKIWICKHKMDFADRAGYPCFYWMFYANREFVIDHKIAEKTRTGPFNRDLRGITERYFDVTPEIAMTVAWFRRNVVASI